MSNISLSLDEIYELAKKTFSNNGCDDETSKIMADLVMKAERDGSLSHGLFRVPAYISGLKSGKINGKGKPNVKTINLWIFNLLNFTIKVFCAQPPIFKPRTTKPVTANSKTNFFVPITLYI